MEFDVFADKFKPSLEELDNLCHKASTTFGLGRKVKQKMFDLGAFHLEDLSENGRIVLADYVKRLIEYEVSK